MPRGRHRHSPPLHKQLPPSAVAGASALFALGAWFTGETLVLRLLVVAAAAAAVTGAVIMRSWDHGAGRRVAELTRARASDQWKAEERIAELEADVEESRELRAKLDAKLRAKRVELAGLRGEHAALLRRYATAETERASALEGRRQLAVDSASPARALPPAGSTPTPAVFARAARALTELSRNAAAQEARRTVEEARARDLADRSRETEDATGRHAARSAAPRTRTVPALPARKAVPAASAVLPHGAQGLRARRPEGGFDFFGTQAGAEDSAQGGPAPRTGAEPAAGTPAGTAGERAAEEAAPAAPAAREQIEAVQDEDLADVVGPEALAAERAKDTRAIGKVIDLTAHDETEQLDVARLRGAVS
ncbi:hypothetical protein [Streptomyces sp. C10-9-1]|uniref:hypothetical protein n=1 Tax=Streptomyces sp. C10-9-1 TaxID=1859285 RepID=UPI003D726DA3